MKFNKDSFKKALKDNRIVRFENHFKHVVKSYLEHETKALSTDNVSNYFAFAKYLNEHYKYFDNTDKGDIYEDVLTKKRLTEIEIYNEWVIRHNGLSI